MKNFPSKKIDLDKLVSKDLLEKTLKQRQIKKSGILPKGKIDIEIPKFKNNP